MDNVAMCRDEAIAGVSDAIRCAIIYYKSVGGENYGAFSISVSYNAPENPGVFVAKCDFDNVYADGFVIIYYRNDGYSKIVDQLFDIHSVYNGVANGLLSDIAHYLICNDCIEWID